MGRAGLDGHIVYMIVDGERGAGISYTMFHGNCSIISSTATQKISQENAFPVLIVSADAQYDLVASKGKGKIILIQIQSLLEKRIRESEEPTYLLEEFLTSRKI